MNGRRDLSWSQVTSPESGLYSKAFLREFNPEATDGEREENLNLLFQSYRRCSEFLHGAVATSSLLPDKLQYSSNVAAEWATVAANALKGVHHALFSRYYLDLTPEARSKIEPCIESHLGHYRSARDALGLPLEGDDL